MLRVRVRVSKTVLIAHYVLFSTSTTYYEQYFQQNREPIEQGPVDQNSVQQDAKALIDGNFFPKKFSPGNNHVQKKNHSLKSHRIQ